MILTEAFAGLSDLRPGPVQRHDLHEMIVMALCAVPCGADTWVDVAEWAEDNEGWLKNYLVLAHGTPSHDTFGRVFRIKSIRQRWPKLTGVGMIERVREIIGRQSTGQAFSVGSKGVTAAPGFANAARSHWAIDNNLHWVLDVTFREDHCRVRNGHAPQNFPTLRKLALALLRTDQTYPKRSLRSRRKTADLKKRPPPSPPRGGSGLLAALDTSGVFVELL